MPKKTQEFKTEIKQILDLIIHSLYSHKEIFLRELVSNACDAIDKVRFEYLTNEQVLEGNAEWKIKLIPDKKKKTLTVSDNGVGMSAINIVENLGTIAKSGTSWSTGSRRSSPSKPQAASNGRSENRIFFRNWNSLGAKPFFLCL